MNDYTSSALASDRYLRDGGHDFGPRVNAMLDSPPRGHCSVITGSHEPPAPLSLTEEEKAVEAARMAAEARLAAIEGRVRLNPWIARNPHD